MNIRTYNIKLIFSVALLLILTSNLFSQGRQRQWQDRYRQLESQRIAFITRELSLSPEEAQVFWPVYNEYNQKRNQLMINHRLSRADEQNLHQLSEAELNELADSDVRNLEEMAALRREYHQKFKQILPTIKVIQLYIAERDFNRKLFNESRGERQMRRNN
jgi:hypothetical protein